MSWNELLKNKSAAKHTTSSQEIENLRAVVTRNLQDASAEGISADGKFGHAYDASLVLAKMVIACSGYRIKGEGAHRNSFIALQLACGPKANEFADYFDQCRRKRNKLSYDMSGLISDREAEELFQKAHEFKEFIESWIATNYPEYM